MRDAARPVREIGIFVAFTALMVYVVDSYEYAPPNNNNQEEEEINYYY